MQNFTLQEEKPDVLSTEELSSGMINLGKLGNLYICMHDCSHKIKRRLLLGREAMTNLNSILKSRDIAFPKKVRLVKAMVFPVVMCGCES